MESLDLTVERVDRALRRHRFRFDDERELQAGIELVLRGEGLVVAREASLGDSGTIDFLVGSLGSVGIEVKTRGSRADLARQVHRYLQHESLQALMVVTTRAALAQLPEVIANKPVYVHHLVTGAF